MDEVEEIKQRLDVAEVVGGYIQLKQAGRNLKAPCPFHNEKTASFMVSPEKGIWHCFGCGEGGDIFKFVMRMEGLEFRPALELLARKAGVELKNSGRGGDNKLKERLYQANEWAVKYFQLNLVRNERALTYVTKQRGLKRQTITDFGIGFAPESWEGLVGALRKKGFSDDELVKAGLAGQRTGGRGLYDMFRGRIMFTIYDGQGRPIGFTGRVLDESLPKYLNTPQTLLYDKSRAIYGLHLAKEAIRQSDEVVLVEGNMDVVASHQAGVKQVVAASGTALTLDQLKTLSKLTASKKFKLAFDMDSAGLKATERVVPLAQKLGLDLFVIEIKDAKDADELIAKDLPAWKTAIANAKEIRQYWLDRSLAEFDLSSILEKDRFISRMSSVLKLYDDKEQQQLFAKHISEVTGIEVGTFLDSIGSVNDFDSTMVSKTTKSSEVASDPKPTDIKLAVAPGIKLIEEAVLALNLAYPEARISLEDLEAGDFPSEAGQAIAANLLKNNDQTATDIAKDLPLLSDYVKILTLRGEEQYGSLAPADRSSEALTLTRRLQNLSNKRKRAQLSRQIRAAEQGGDPGLVGRLRDEYQGLIESNI